MSVEVENELKGKYNVDRIEGGDLFSIAVEIGEEVRKIKGFDTVALATQNDFPDALTEQYYQRKRVFRYY